MAKYRLSRKKNRLNREKDGRWYAEPASMARMSSRQFCRQVTQHTTLSPFELGMGLEIVGDRLPWLLARGFNVELGELGSFRIEFGSEGVDEPEDFNYHLIRRPRIVFHPSRKLQREVARLVSYELDGLTADGIQFADIASYRRWQQEQQQKLNESEE